MEFEMMMPEPEATPPLSRADRRRARAREYARRRYEDPEYREMKKKAVLDAWHLAHPEARRYKSYPDVPSGGATMAAVGGGILGILVGMAFR
jgi:hypothetical protein